MSQRKLHLIGFAVLVATSVFLLILYCGFTVPDEASDKSIIEMPKKVIKENSAVDNDDAPYMRRELAYIKRLDIKEHLEYLDFGIKFRSFFDEYKSAQLADRVYIADKLRERIIYYESKGYISLAEAYYMELNLIEAVVSDDYLTGSRVSELKDSYNKLSAERQRVSRHLDDKKNKEYKVKEGNIVESISDMKVFPRGMGSQEYLEWKLDQARQEVYGDD